MNRAGTLTVEELMAQLAASATEIAALKAEKETLSQRVVKLEDGFALEKRRAPDQELNFSGGENGSGEAAEGYGRIQAGGTADFVVERPDNGRDCDRSGDWEIDAGALEGGGDGNGIAGRAASGHGEGAGAAAP
jgi:hypothetical protein